MINKEIHSCSPTSLAGRFAVLFILLLVGSCTQNNGDLHGLFGKWKVMEITINQQPDADYEVNMIWSFQSSIINMQTIDDFTNSVLESRFGTFEREGSTLTFNFTHSDDFAEPGKVQYAPIKESHFPASIFNVTIVELTGSKMQLLYVADDGTTYNYFLKKWG